LHAALPRAPCVLIGWSLGGLLAMTLAGRAPHRVRGLVLVASTPCFVARPDWPLGVREDRFAAFREAAAAPTARRLGRFFHLMLHGEGLSRPRIRALAREVGAAEGMPRREALEAGLRLLADLDLRGRVAGLAVPCLVVHGRRDAIVPVAAGRWLAEHLPRAEWVEYADAGHAPFLTRAREFNRRLEAWCRSHGFTAAA